VRRPRDRLGGLNRGKKRRRIHLPTYPFQRARHWIDAAAMPDESRARRDAPVRLSSQDWLYEPSWKRRTLGEPPDVASAESSAWVVFGSDEPVANAFMESLRRAGQVPVRVTLGSGFRPTIEGFEIDPDDETAYVALMRELPPARCVNVAYFWSSSLMPARETASGSSPLPIEPFLTYPVMLAQALKRGGCQSVRFALFTAGLHRVHGEETGDPLAALCLGPVRTIPREWEGFRCAAIDLPEDPAHAEPFARRAWTELAHGLPDEVVAYRTGGRWVECFERRPLSRGSSRLAKSATCLLTGGFGGIGFELARHLISSWGSRLIVVGRSSLEGTQSSAVNARECLAKLAAMGGEVEYVAADVADEHELRAGVEAAERRLGRIDAAFHLAGVADGRLLELRRADEMRAIVNGKVGGALSIARLISERPDSFLVLFSSITGFLGDVGQVAYTAANAFLGALAQHSSVPITAIGWDTWRDVGMAVRTELPQALRALRQRALAHAISVPEGLQVLDRILADRTPSVVVCTTDLEDRVLSHRKPRVQASPGNDPRQEMYPRPPLPSEFVEPESETERSIAALWRESLRIESVGALDDFFELGGTSLHAVQLAGRIQSVLGKQVMPDVLLQHGTVRGLAAFFDEQRESPSRPACLVELASGDPAKPPLFLVHPVGGQVMVYRDLVRTLRVDCRVFGIKADPGRDPASTVEQIAADYVTAARAVHPEGPFVLGGSSFGGMVAFEMAQQLTRAGFAVPLVALIDTPGAEQVMAPLKSEAEVVEYLRPQWPSQDEGSTLQDVVNTFSTNDRAMRLYRPTAYAGHVLYFRAQVRRDEDPLEPDAPWRAVCSRFELKDVPGDHLSVHTMPHVQLLAAGLSAALGVIGVPTRNES
jgi:thioesterase domain-containing protein/NADP-dependent 3-hydroxy acid dehydrogenase YdfG